MSKIVKEILIVLAQLIVYTGLLVNLFKYIINYDINFIFHFFEKDF
jgi:hypothetical protein